MFTEILKVKPVLDKGAAKSIELSLNARFKRVATNFGKGIQQKFKLSATAMGAALAGALGAAMLNPIKEVEDKVNDILQRGRAAKLQAEDLGTTAGKLLQLRAVAESKGMDPDQINSMLQSFQKQRNDVAYKQSQGQKLNATEQALANLPADTIDGFFTLQKTLQALDDKTRARLTRELLGDEASYGSTKRFLNSDINKEIKALGNIPRQNRLNRDTDILAKQAEKQLKADARRGLNEYAGIAENKNLSAVVDTGIKRSDEQSARLMNQMDMYKELAQVRKGVDEVNKGIDKLVAFLGEQIPTLVAGAKWIMSGKIVTDLGKELGRVWKAIMPKWAGGNG